MDVLLLFYLNNMKNYILAILITLSLYANAQVGLNQTVLVNATANGDGTLTLTWPKAVFTGNYKVYKNTSTTPLNFTTATATLASTDTAWTDANATAGKSTEYAVTKVNASNQIIALGYILAGNKAAEIPSFGSVILVVDSNYILPLSNEIQTLANDLESRGQKVYITYAGRGEKVTAVKSRIQAIYDSKKPTPEYLYLLGHIPVPYSGNFSGITGDMCAYPPDGHVENSGNHTGAWPADVYYAEFEGFYTDNSVTKTTGTQSRHHNIPGDGKFDQCAPPTPLVLKMGRVDLTNMPIFGSSDTVLTKNYLDKAHKWRMDAVPYVERGLIDDNFTGLDLSSTGWNNITACIRRDSVFGNRDYFASQNVGNYLWSYGCGAGSYTNCSGIGGTNNFNPGIYSNIFTALAGSFFGDWDVSNNFLRAPLCTGSLLSFWGGIPRWYAHYFALGIPMGNCAMITQNSTSQSFNGSENKVHIDLMGDPTLTYKCVPPAGKLKLNSSNGNVNLSWIKATGKFDGYVVYKIDSVSNKWIRLNSNIITDTFFTDNNNFSTGKYKYAVRTIRLEQTASGSYYNLGGGGYNWVQHTNTLAQTTLPTIQISPNPARGEFVIQLSNSSATRISATDLAGKNIPVEWTDLGDNSIKVYMPAQTSGLYLIQVHTPAGVIGSKVFLQP